MLVFLFACATSVPTAPTSATVPAPVPDPPGETMTINVPPDCPHVIVDIVSDDTSDVTVACFDRYSGRTYLESYRAMPIGVFADPVRKDKLVIEFWPRDEPVRAAARQ